MTHRTALAVGLTTLLALPAAADPVRDRLDKARAAYEAEAEKLTKPVLDALQSAEAVARRGGDKAALDRLRAERTAFDLAAVLPKSAPAPFQRRAASLRYTLETAYAQAIKEYTRTGQDAPAAAAQKELDRFKADPALFARYFKIENRYSGLALDAEGDAARRSKVTQTRYARRTTQQWSFAPSPIAGQFFLKNRQSGLGANVHNESKEDGAEVVLWPAGVPRKNDRWAVVKQGEHWQIQSTFSDLYLSAPGKEAAVPVIQWKPTGELNQLWDITPVKDEK